MPTAADRIRLEGYSDADEQRWAPESAKSQERTEFERDRARLIHSSALRRLGAKTQIQTAGTDDFVRTRLTHSLEVAQIGRQIGEALGLDPDVVDCACLAHDLGHPPFGHNGEKALAQIATAIGGFEGNAQTFHIVTRLEPKVFFPDGKPAGVNLTRAALDATVKYPWTYAQAPEFSTDARSLKFCIYPDDEEAFRWLRRDAPASIPGHVIKPMEGQVMDLADDIAYSVHDVEDAVVMNLCSLADVVQVDNLERIIEDTQNWYGKKWKAEKLTQAYLRLARLEAWQDALDYRATRRSLAALKNLTSSLIGRFCSSVEQATRDTYGNDPLTRYSASLVIPEETEYEIIAMKGIAVHYVMQPREELYYHRYQLQVIQDLVSLLMEKGEKPSPFLEPEFAADWAQANNDGERLRVAIDQVASLTDNSALRLHHDVFETSTFMEQQSARYVGKDAQ